MRWQPIWILIMFMDFATFWYTRLLKHNFENGIRSSNLSHKMTKASSDTWFAFALHEKRVPTSRDFILFLAHANWLQENYESLLWDGPHSSADDTYFLWQSKNNSLEICNIWWDFKSSGIERNYFFLPTLSRFRSHLDLPLLALI